MAISYNEEIEQRDKAIRAMIRIIWGLLVGKIRIKHCWLVKDYWDDDEPHNWFSIEWLEGG